MQWLRRSCVLSQLQQSRRVDGFRYLEEVAWSADEYDISVPPAWDLQPCAVAVRFTFVPSPFRTCSRRVQGRLHVADDTLRTRPWVALSLEGPRPLVDVVGGFSPASQLSRSSFGVNSSVPSNNTTGSAHTAPVEDLWRVGKRADGCFSDFNGWPGRGTFVEGFDMVGSEMMLRRDMAKDGGSMATICK